MQFNSLLQLALVASASAQSITDVLTGNSASLSTLTSLVQAQPAILSALQSATNVTILAPNNAAFAAFLNTTGGAAAAAQPDVVAALLQYHVLTGNFPGSAFTSTSQFIPTLLTNTSYTNVTGGQRVEAEVEDGSVVITSGLGRESKVVTADVKFNGGTIHVIDTVLTIPTSASDTASAANLTSLASALASASLVPTVNGLKDVTIFAPDNEAFDDVASTTSTLNATQLSSILTYHVVAGTVGYSTTLSNTTLKTVNGANVNITVTPDDVLVNGAEVKTADVLVANGVVHVIESVLSPTNATTPMIMPTGAATQTLMSCSFVAALSLAFAVALSW